MRIRHKLKKKAWNKTDDKFIVSVEFQGRTYTRTQYYQVIDLVDRKQPYQASWLTGQRDARNAKGSGTVRGKAGAYGSS